MKKDKLNIDKDAVLKNLQKYSKKLASEKNGSAADYANLQLTWNYDILYRSLDYLPRDSSKIMGIGSFYGTVEMALAPYMNEVVCVDFKNFLPRWRQKNVNFHKANIDTSEWKLPTLKQSRYDAVYLIETIEHLLWSPLPLLQWIHKNSHMAVISTPDDDEWPAMEIHPWSHFQSYKQIPPASPGAKSNPSPMFHTKQYKQDEFIEMLDSVGFRVNEFFRTGEGRHQMVAIIQPR